MPKSFVLEVWLSRLRRLAAFLSVQVVIQGLNVVSGLMVLRTMEKREYAFYTLAISMQSAFAILSECGVTTGVNAIGGQVWNSPRRFGQLIQAGRIARFRLATLVLICLGPLMISLLMVNGCSLADRLSLTALILASGWLQLTIDTIRCVPLFYSQVREVQRLDLLWSGSRVGLLAVLIIFNYMTAFTGILAVFICFALQYYLFEKLVGTKIEKTKDFIQEDLATINKIVRIQFVNALYFCLQSQVMFFLLSIFGKTESLADMGALSRFSVLGPLIASAMAYLVQPVFSKCQDKGRLLKIYFQVVGCILLLCLVFVGSAFLFPDIYLYVLGPKYSQLKWEFFLMTINISINIFGGSLFSLNNARGWVRLSWLYTPITIAAQILVLMLINVRSFDGTILFGILAVIPGIFLTLYIAREGFNQINKLTPPSPL